MRTGIGIGIRRHFTLGLAASALATASLELVERFDATGPWNEHKLGGGDTHFSIETEASGKAVLRVESEGAASALWRGSSLAGVEEGRVSWRWKVEHSLEAPESETTRGGDDFAARLFVIFDPVLFDGSMRALCYVWAAELPQDTVFESPYSEKVATIVLRSGDELAGMWVTEDRNFVDDFRRFFDEPPERVTGVALMVDTDNTGARATAWFDDIELRASRSVEDPFRADLAGEALEMLDQ